MSWDWIFLRLLYSKKILHSEKTTPFPVFLKLERSIWIPFSTSMLELELPIILTGLTILKFCTFSKPFGSFIFPYGLQWSTSYTSNSIKTLLKRAKFLPSEDHMSRLYPQIMKHYPLLMAKKGWAPLSEISAAALGPSWHGSGVFRLWSLPLFQGICWFYAYYLRYLSGCDEICWKETAEEGQVQAWGSRHRERWAYCWGFLL